MCRFSVCSIVFRLSRFPVRFSAYITRISTNYRMQYIACIRLYPFVSCLAACRHLEGAVNLQFYSVLLHFIRSLILIGYQPNDKELIKVRPIIAANFQTSFASYVYRYTCFACVCNGCGNFKERLYRCTMLYSPLPCHQHI